VAERKPTILVVDDEVALLDVMETYLHDDGFNVLRASDGRAAVDIALRERPDLVLLDLNLPTLSGLEAFREMRAQLSVPVIMLTSRGAEVDRVVGLELGADDYIPKPYSPREVVARVKAVLRRSAAAVPAAPSGPQHDVCRVGDLLLDRTAHEVTRDDEAVRLTPTEYRLLEVFMSHPGQAFTRDHLIELISTDGGDVFDRTLDRHIANMRQKIETDAQRPKYILTVYGVGYKMADLS
jgi:two-component system, OmpR family, alkaline phosphatase synthesis response regulator PhoP